MYSAPYYDLQQKSFQEKPAAEQNCLIFLGWICVQGIFKKQR